MGNHIDDTLAQAQAKLKSQEDDVAQTKRFINQLLAFDGRPPMFQDTASSSAALTMHGDEYYGQKQQTAARLVLERRKAMNLGPATLDEIFEAMKAGGYKHDARDDSMAGKSLYNTLTQNSSTFHRLPTGKFGLTAWYPNAPKKKRKKGDDGADDGDPTEPETESGQKLLTEGGPE
jgi:hypothetical protein